MTTTYVNPDTYEQALELFHAGLLYMNQDTSCSRCAPHWQPARKHLMQYLENIYAPGFEPVDEYQYVKADIGYLVED